MASVKFQKGSEEWAMFNEYWSLVQKYYIPEDTDQYWDDVIADMNRFAKKYASVPLARKITMAFMQTLEDKYKKQRK